MTQIWGVIPAGQIDFCIKGQKFPRVKELCKPYLQLLMGRIYAEYATSHSWGGIMQVLICIKSMTATLFQGKDLCKTQKE